MRKAGALILCGVIVVVGRWSIRKPYSFTVSPDVELKFVDLVGKPIRNIEVERYWHSTIRDSGSDKKLSDTLGQVKFERVILTTRNSVRLKMFLLQFIPAVCGFGGEVSGYSTCYFSNIKLEIKDSEWKKASANIYKNPEGFVLSDDGRKVSVSLPSSVDKKYSLILRVASGRL